MAGEISSHGFSVGYIVETTAGTRPTTGSVTAIPNVKGLGDMNPEPANLECTDLSQMTYKQYIPGLKDVSNIPITVNITDAFKTAWAACVSTYGGLTGGKGMWFQFVVPNFSDAFWVRGVPNELGFPGVEVDQVFSGEVYITANQIAGWATKLS